MKWAIATTILLTGLLSARLAFAKDEVNPVAADAARRVAVTTCSTCHGPQGRSIAPKFPRLAGQNANYLVAQMKNFKAQSRGDPDAVSYMWGMVGPLSDEMINGLAAYYSAQRPAHGEPSDPVVVARGREIFVNGVAADGIPSCAACHGQDAAGIGDFPRLAGQSREYLLKQLRSFQSNLRDVAVMHGVASGLRVDDMAAVASFLQSLGP